tara:strand:- start:166 stop:822 length:657 start_codon:yes stop_codon:yes gene_type:complete
MQRFFDILLSSLAIIVLFPILFIVSIILKLTGENEIFYSQERVGKYGESFGVIKFATMLKDSPNIGAGEITVQDDPRVLPFGKFLRKSKINELPQLWNIFVGDMSIVGPRPMVPNTYAKYDSEARACLNRIRPGLTGIGSIIFRDEEKLLEDKENAQEFYDNNIIPHKAKLEKWYVNNASLSLYIKCIIITVWVVLFPRSTAHLNFLSSLPEMPEYLK